MKKLWSVLCFHALCLNAADLSWTFRWDDTDCGIYFEDTNVTATTKMAVRDDVTRILSFNPASNATFNALMPTDPRYGQYAGKFSLSRGVYPSQFTIQYYNTFDGTNFLVCPPGMTSNYLVRIAMTNQALEAYSCLSNFVNTINQVSTNTLSQTTFASLFWTIEKNRVATQGDFNEQGADYLFIVNDLAKYQFGFQSICDFGTGIEDGESLTCCSLIFRRKINSTSLWSRWPIIYKEGQWRLIPAYEMPK